MDVNERLDRLEQALWHDRGKAAIYERTITALVAVVIVQYPNTKDLFGEDPKFEQTLDLPEDVMDSFLEGIQDGLSAIKAVVATQIKTRPPVSCSHGNWRATGR